MKINVERKFFKISQQFFFIITSVSLAIAVGCFFYALHLYTATPKEKISQPTPSYTDLLAKKAREAAAAERQKARQEARKEAAPTSNAEPAPPKNPESIPAEYLDTLNSIEKSIVSFANKARQVAPSDKLRFRIYKAAERYTAYVAIPALLQQLDAEAKKLEADAERIRSLQQSAPDYITWAEFLDNFFEQIDINIAEQEKNINIEKEQVRLKKAFSYFIFYTAAVAFCVFILFTMFLVIISMERNTYILRSIHERLQKEEAASK
jgi:hypothetical protein